MYECLNIDCKLVLKTFMLTNKGMNVGIETLCNYLRVEHKILYLYARTTVNPQSRLLINTFLQG